MGVYKISKRLAVEYGIYISSGRVYRLMKSMNLPKMSTVKPAFKPLKSDNSLPCINFLKQKFTTAKPNLVWVSDMTYIKVNGKFTCLCVIIDLFSRKFISYSVSNKPDAELVTHALNSAYAKRNPNETLIFHSDRGCQYT